MQWTSELQRGAIELRELIGSIKCGEFDTRTGMWSCPPVSQVVDHIVDTGGTVLLGETPNLIGGEHLIADRMATSALPDKFMDIYRNYFDEIES